MEQFGLKSPWPGLGFSLHEVETLFAVRSAQEVTLKQTVTVDGAGGFFFNKEGPKSLG
jgi:hypothetical protein